MEKLQFVDYLIVGLAIWLAVLTFYCAKVIGSWNRLTKSGQNPSLAQILENIIKEQRQVIDSIENIKQEIGTIEGRSKSYFQKHALVRFNPFEDTGGDQSFIIALLNGQNNGFVISSLHSRNGTRIYAKQIQDAKPLGHEFSKEEKELIEKAIRPGAQVGAKKPENDK